MPRERVRLHAVPKQHHALELLPLAELSPMLEIRVREAPRWPYGLPKGSPEWTRMREAAARADQCDACGDSPALAGEDLCRECRDGWNGCE